MGVEAVSTQELPAGWELLPLGEACTVNPRRPHLSRDDDVPTSFLPMAGVDEIHGVIADLQTQPYSKVRRGYTYFEEEDVLFAKITPSMQNGKSAIARGLIDGLGFGSTEFHVLRPSKRVIPEWVHLFVRQKRFRDEAVRHFRGAVGQQRVPEEFLGSYPLPVPPRAEQRRIVARIQALFDRMEEARRLRAAADQDADRLMPAALEEIFAQPDPGWLTAELNNVAFVQTGTAKGRRFGNRKTVELPYLRVANVQAGYLMLDEIKTIRIAEDEIERYRLHPGDLLLTEGGDFDKLGRGAVWNAEIEPCLHQNHIFAVRLDQSKILPRFAEYEMQSWYAKTYFLRSAKKTTNLASINKTQLSAFPICYPSLMEQRHIIEYLDGVQAQVAELRRLQAASATELERLREAVLARAFQGEL
jgi:type I restriction enzyme S subunit